MGLDEVITLVIDEDKEYEVEVVNERKLVELQIYKCDEDKIYNLCFGKYDIKFTHNGSVITVCDVIKREEKEKHNEN